MTWEVYIREHADLLHSLAWNAFDFIDLLLVTGKMFVGVFQFCGKCHQRIVHGADLFLDAFLYPSYCAQRFYSFSHAAPKSSLLLPQSVFSALFGFHFECFAKYRQNTSVFKSSLKFNISSSEFCTWVEKSFYFNIKMQFFSAFPYG